MRNRLNQLFGTVVLAAAMVALAGRAEAAAIVYVTPTPVIVEVGENFNIEVFIDADDPVGGFDIDAAWDSAILTWSVISLHYPFFDGPFTFFDTSASGATGSVAGDPTGDNLAGLAFKAFTFNFNATAVGVTAISLPFANLSDELGDALLDQQALGGVVCVVADKRSFDPADCAVAVPEPGLLALLATGLATVASRRRRRAS